MTHPLDRRDLLAAAPLLGLLPQFLGSQAARAAPDPTKTIVVPPPDIAFTPELNGPPGSVEKAELFSKPSAPGPYLVLIRWHPGWMSAPHSYATDRLCMVLSGTWWVTSGDAFDPGSTVPAPAGTFVRRVANTSHYDGVRADGREPATIAIYGIGPIAFRAVDPSKPNIRRL